MLILYKVHRLHPRGCRTLSGTSRKTIGAVRVTCFNGERRRENEVLRTALQREDIPTVVCYPVCIHKMALYSAYPTSEAAYPVAEKAVSEVISLPLNPKLCKGLQEKIVGVLLRCATIITTLASQNSDKQTQG